MYVQPPSLALAQLCESYGNAIVTNAHGLQVLNLVCLTCGKPCRSETERELHIKRTGHSDFENRVSPYTYPSSSNFSGSKFTVSSRVEDQYLTNGVCCRPLMHKSFIRRQR